MLKPRPNVAKFGLIPLWLREETYLEVYGNDLTEMNEIGKNGLILGDDV
jgi:hypothetical protein